MARFGMAIAWHAVGWAVRRQIWPAGQHVRPDFYLRVPVTPYLAKLYEWEPALVDMDADDWETAGNAAQGDVIEVDSFTDRPEKGCDKRTTLDP